MTKREKAGVTRRQRECGFYRLGGRAVLPRSGATPPCVATRSHVARGTRHNERLRFAHVRVAGYPEAEMRLGTSG